MREPMKTVLCFGDSNTWGYAPGTGGRFGYDKRWPGVLRAGLGEDYTVIEEGLNGRTTVWDDPIELHKNGAAYLPPCLDTHKPIDLIILMLGTNDLKKRFSLSAFDIRAGAERLLKIIAGSGSGQGKQAPKVLLLSPPYVGPLSAPFTEMFEGAENKSRGLNGHYKTLAQTYGCEFLDAAKIVTASPVDGIHLEEDQHKKLGEALTYKVLSIFKEF